MNTQKFTHKYIKNLFSFEMLFILFLFAGIYKADPRLKWVPVDLTALFFVLSVISGLVIWIKKGKVFEKKALNLFLLYLLFASWVLFSYLWTPGKVYATQKLLYIWTLVLWAFAAPALIIAIDRIRLKRLGLIYIILSLIVAMETMRQFIFADTVWFMNIFGSTYLGLGRVLGLSFLLLVAYLVFEDQSIYKKILVLILTGLYFFLLLIGGGRGPLLAAIISALIPLVFSVNIKISNLTIKVKPYIIPLVILIFSSGFFVLFLVESGYTTHTFNRLLAFTQLGMGDSVEVRVQSYTHAIKYWNQAPFWGFGIGSWPVLYDSMDLRSYPHNIFLEILVELGLVGVVLFSAFILKACSYVAPLKSIADKQISITLLMLISFTLINAMISGDIPDNRDLFACIGLMPAALYWRNP